MVIMNKKAKNSFKRIIDSPGFALIGFICSLVGLIVSLTNNNWILKLICAIFLFVCLVLIIIFILVRWFSIRSAKMNIENQFLEKEKNAGNYNHKFFHTLRDWTNYLDNNENVTRETFKDKAKDLCNLVDDFYTDFLDDDTINVCIKLFDYESTKESDYGKWKTYTFVRSNSSDTNREEYDKQLIEISKNTDYEIILSNDPQFQGVYCFVSENLKKTKEVFIEKYNKEFVCYNPKHKYQSKIIVPIRIRSDYVSKKYDFASNTFSHHIIGFLCIDSERTYDNVLSDYRYSTFNLSVNYAKSFADSLYHFFDSYLINEITFQKNNRQKD